SWGVLFGASLLEREDDHHGRNQAQADTRSSQAEVVRALSPAAVRPVPRVLPERPGGESCDSEPKGLTVSPRAGWLRASRGQPSFSSLWSAEITKNSV